MNGFRRRGSEVLCSSVQGLGTGEVEGLGFLKGFLKGTIKGSRFRGLGV